MEKKTLQLFTLHLGNSDLFEVRLNGITIHRSRSKAEAEFYFENYEVNEDKEELLKSKLV